MIYIINYFSCVEELVPVVFVEAQPKKSIKLLIFLWRKKVYADETMTTILGPRNKK